VGVAVDLPPHRACRLQDGGGQSSPGEGGVSEKTASTGHGERGSGGSKGTAKEVRRLTGLSTRPFLIYCGPLEALPYPNFDERLTRHPKAACLTIETVNHPHGKIHVDPLLFLSGAKCFGQIKAVIDVNLTIVEDFIQIFSFHRVAFRFV
jgi:hypothetical protein